MTWNFILITIKREIMLKTVYIIIISFIATVAVKAQGLDSQVTVTKDFEPVIQNADKINLQPDIKDTIHIKPDFKYRVYPIPAKSTFEVKSIKAAKLVGIPISELYNYYLSAGVGNHHWPFLKIYANNLRSDDYSIGAALNVENIEGKIKLDNGQKVNAANSNINLTGYGKKIFNTINLEGNIGIDLNKIHYYGLATDTIYDPVPQGKDIKQNFSTFFAQAKIYSTNPETEYSFGLEINEEHTWDRFDYFENDFTLTSLNKLKLSLFDLHIDGEFRMLNNNFRIDTSVNTSVFSISPYLNNSDGDFRYKIGMKFTLEKTLDNSIAYLYPNAGIEYSPAGSILTMYFGLDGDLVTHSYNKLLKENPFLSPGTMVNSTNNKVRAFAGIKGDLSKTLSYYLEGRLVNVKDQMLYVKDTIGIFDNFYSVVYDNVDITSVGGGINYTIKNKLFIILSGNKYSYLAGNEEYAWHLPEWDLDFNIQYNLQKKVTLTGNLKMTGTRYAKDLDGQAVKLKPFAVFDLRIDYNFSKALSAFVSVKNLNASQYEIWYQYPYFKTMVMVGMAYKF